MSQLVVLVVHDPGKVDEVVKIWVESGVPGITLLDSCGLGHHLGRHEMRDDIPLLPSVRSLLRAQESPNRTILSVVDDGFDLDQLVARTEAVLGSLIDEGTGILFAVPLSRVVGRQSPGE